ncbi:MAG: hypothetical protein HY615_13510 [Candidatus Rokubacteria bacterium]|nr:hypothetical protein [Candidatus Rokubacteria bacterium]
MSVPDAAPGDDSLSIDLIRRRLASERLGRHIYLFGQIAPRAQARRLAEAGAEEGTVVLSEDGASLHLAVVLRPDLPLRAAVGLAPLAARALAETLAVADAPDAAECTVTAHGAQYVIFSVGAEWHPRRVTGRRVDRNAFTATFLNHLDHWVACYEAEGLGALDAGCRASSRFAHGEQGHACH